MAKRIVLPAFLMAATVLSACASTQDALRIGEGGERNAGPCPRAFALYDAARIVEFRGERQAYANVGFTGEIAKVRALCRYVGERPIVGDMDITFDLGRGPAATEDTATYQYWVAITRKNRAVINKQTFPLTVQFPEGADRVRVVETIDQYVIPRANETTSGENFEIIVGFEVTPEQRAFNADGRRFRVNAGQN